MYFVRPQSFSTEDLRPSPPKNHRAKADNRVMIYGPKSDAPIWPNLSSWTGNCLRSRADKRSRGATHFKAAHSLWASRAGRAILDIVEAHVQ
jgi:hypothetical protein